MPPELWIFQVKLDRHLDGDRPAFTPGESGWFDVFRAVANSYDCLPPTTSFDLSLQALRRCFDRGRAGYRNYLRQACWRAHQQFLTRERRRHDIRHVVAQRMRPRGERPDAIDLRLDVEAALEKLPPRLAMAVRLRNEGTARGDIANALGVCEAQVSRTIGLAKRRLRHLLGAYQEG